MGTPLYGCCAELLHARHYMRPAAITASQKLLNKSTLMLNSMQPGVVPVACKAWQHLYCTELNSGFSHVSH